MTYVYKKYEVKIKMVQELKMKFLLIYNNCASELDSIHVGACEGLPRKGKIFSSYVYRMVSVKKCYISFKLETISHLKHKLLTILLFPNVVLQVKHKY